ncbi:hypothetical protein C7C46_13960 [Streptomyces tateyamensis]|uniref:HTH araC/xylS-type domain-containing protein n=1 Tax=Streptomyces tateyamensis TaxID=565073 RepID=A0A2V4N636_9ACTN|nr:AraC family transcriptional regulator ligand-binding domain-containing protein [Streptomyces tateyamensis]PYC79467.1 hypothetical protein C7C46_13960 [Streptomyces tateyamensis]
MTNGTISTALMRGCVAGLGAAGVGADRYARLAGLEPDTLADDLARVPTATGLLVWEQLVLAARHTCLAQRLVESVPAGSLGVWDHLFTSGATVLDGARDAGRYFHLLSDPEIDALQVVRSGSQVTLRFSCATAEPEVVAAVQEFALVLFLQRARQARRAPIVPVHAALVHRAPRDHSALTRLLGTRNLEFGAASNSLTFLADDAATALPDFRPGLPEVLRRHADMTLAATRPALTWQDRFRAALLAGCAGGGAAPSLESTARRLALSPRTLQRRLYELGTTFRQEVESVREQRAMQLVRDSELSLPAIAARVGYRDVRTLRRAVRAAGSPRRSGTSSTPGTTSTGPDGVTAAPP